MTLNILDRKDLSVSQVRSMQGEHSMSTNERKKENSRGEKDETSVYGNREVEEKSFS